MVYMNYIDQLTKNENTYQRNNLNLIASENYPSPNTLKLLGSIWNDKYAEGYPRKRYYAGNVNTDDLESFVQSKALEIFDNTGEYGVNVQPLSGSSANAIVYMTVLDYGDTVLSLDLSSGGHLSHLHETSSYSKFFKYANYNLLSKKNGYLIDMDDYVYKLKANKPRIVIIGFSSYPKKYEFSQMCKIAHEHGALVLADISHISGLVAVGQHDTPFNSGPEGADFVVTTTHKTLRGPRSAMIFAKKEYMPALNHAVFPGTMGGPHLNQIASLGQALLEVSGEEQYPDKLNFSDYIEMVIKNTKSLETGLVESGASIVAPTQNHLCLIELSDNIDSLEMQNNLEKMGIITNRNSIPNEKKSPWRPSGLRLGAAALTSRGLMPNQARELGVAIGSILNNTVSNRVVNEFVTDLSSSLKWYY